MMISLKRLIGGLPTPPKDFIVNIKKILREPRRKRNRRK